MRVFLNLLAVVMLLPTLAFACAIILLGHLISAPSLLVFLWRVLIDFVWVLPWGLLGIGLLVVALIACGATRLRWLGGLVTALLSLLSAAVVLAFAATPQSAEEAAFFVPGLASFAIGAWLAWTEWPRQTAWVQSTGSP